MSRFKLLPTPIGITTLEEAEELAEYLADAPILAVDTETTGLSRPNDYALILAISDGVDRWAVWPAGLPAMKKLLENPELKLIMHNANFDQWMLKNVGIYTDRHTKRNHYRVYDTMVMHALVNDGAPHDLKSLSRDYLGIEMVSFMKVFAKELRRKVNGVKNTLETVLLNPDNYDIVLNYAALDAFATFHLFLALRKALLEMSVTKWGAPYKTLWDYYLATELPFTKVLWHMELAGFLIDEVELESRRPELQAQIAKVERWFVRETGDIGINLKSNPQMARLFFEKLEYEPLTFTDSGAPQLNKATLSRWAKGGCTYAKQLLKHRDLVKKLRTYVDAILASICKRTGRLHASFNQTGARTGRLSSSNPNLQNQPFYIRSAYIARPGYRLRVADYSQLEMRILAHISGDETLINAINSGQDVHTATAAKMFKVSYDDIMEARRLDDEDQELTAVQQQLLKFRKAAKTINFGLMYGQGAGALAYSLDISLDEAKSFIQQYFATFPKVMKYFERAIASATAIGYTQTILGRRRQVGGLSSWVRGDRSSDARKVKNSPIQGAAADITKMAMILIWEDDVIADSGAILLAQVHDELVLEVPEDMEDNDLFNDRFHNLMTHPLPFDLDVPLDITDKYADTWAEAK